MVFSLWVQTWCLFLCFLISSFYEETSHIGLELTQWTHFNSITFAQPDVQNQALGPDPQIQLYSVLLGIRTSIYEFGWGGENTIQPTILCHLDVVVC